MAGVVTTVRILSHLPVVVGAVMALWVWRSADTSLRIRSPAPGVESDEIVLPDHASEAASRASVAH